MTSKRRLDIVYTVLVVILALLLLQQYYDLLNSWTGGNDQGQTEESAVYDEAKLMQPFEIAVSVLLHHRRLFLPSVPDLCHRSTNSADRNTAASEASQG